MNRTKITARAALCFLCGALLPEGFDRHYCHPDRLPSNCELRQDYHHLPHERTSGFEAWPPPAQGASVRATSRMLFTIPNS